jgi:hypothetical protein
VHAFDTLLQLLERQRISYDFIVVLQGSGREVNKGLKIGIVISENEPG